MLSRETIIRNLEKYKLDIVFYIELCRLLEIYNDIYYFYGEGRVKKLRIYGIINDIAYTVFNKLNIEQLLKMYPLYLKEHIHFFVYCKKFNIDIDLLIEHFEKPIIRENEFDAAWEKSLHMQLLFIVKESSYHLDETYARWGIVTYSDVMENKLANFPLVTYLKSININDSEIFRDILKELIDEVYQLCL